MAITATIALSPATIKAGAAGGLATVTVTNTAAGGPAIAVLGARPVAYDQGTTQPTEAVVLGLPDIGLNGQPNTAASGSGTFVFTFPYNAFAPQVVGSAGGPIGPAANYQYDITCEVLANNGTIVSPTAATLTVTEASHS